MKNKITAVKIYKTFIITLASVLVISLTVKYFFINANRVNYDKTFWLTLALMTLLVIPSNKLVLKIPNSGEVRFSENLYYASFLLFNPAIVCFLILISTLQNFFYKIKFTSKKNLFFICANSILIYGSASAVYYELALPSLDFPAWQKVFPAFMFAAIICYVLKNTLDNLYKIISQKIPIYYFWNFHQTKTLLNLFILSPLGFFTGCLAQLNLFMFLLFLFPLAVIFNTLQNYLSLLWEIREALKTIASLIDKKEASFTFHSYSVANIGRKIAQHLKLSEDAVNKVYNAGLIHDLGKIGVSDTLLRKETALTAKEFDKIKNHPSIGADLVKNLSSLSAEAVIIQHHHEHYDGSGYPEGLDGDKIPLGSRILAVSEAYNTLISKHPYKEKLTKKEAVEEIKQSKGFQFDPQIVEALLKVVKYGN